jgi:asparagine synthase (glutamine-hydrolysing)
MCGITGIVAFSPSAGRADREELRRIRDAQASRGPDGSGEWFSTDGRVALGHRRLTIIGLDDLSAQPMTNHDGSVVVVFNGEIYNYAALKRRLVSNGREFKSGSDTEVLLHLYAERGPDMVDELRGMFAFALWDQRQQRLLLARDPYGIKPVYYSWHEGTFRFASQVKALLAGGGVPRRLDPGGLVGFLLWGSVPEPFTCFEEVGALPSGATMTVDVRGPAHPVRYFEPRTCYERPAHRRGRPELAERLRQAFESSVRAHLVADVPVGAFLSAGVDSTAIACVAARLSSEPLRTVTLAFDEFAGTPMDEAPLAEQTARLLGCNHETIRLTFADVLSGMGDVARAMDQPSVDGVNSYWVSLAANRRGLKVALSGLGGDELFGGYESFKRVPQLIELLGWPGRLGVLRPLSGLARRFLPPGRRRDKYVGLLDGQGTIEGTYFALRGLFMPHELPSILGADYVREGLRRYSVLEQIRSSLPATHHAEQAVAVLEQSLYMGNQLLRDTDWASMAHSLEVRVPLVDRELYETVAAALVPGERGRPAKALLAEAAGNNQVGRQLARRKTGFAFPFDAWLRSGTWHPWPEQLDAHVFSKALPGVVTRWKHEAKSGRLAWARPYAVSLLSKYLAEA